MAKCGGGGGGLKKGPWTQAEDKLLLDHVRLHGHGNWNAVRRETGLQRCGKSCRLRWTNHLRPHLRKGPFSPEEERSILVLHGLIGNKWARIALQLNGRTDNEVKNYWNTRLKRRQRAGLSIYPPDVEREIALRRAHNINPFVVTDADAHNNASANDSLQSPFLYDAGNPFALLPPPAPTTTSHSPMINQSYPLLSQMQGGGQMQAAFHHQLGNPQQPAFQQLDCGAAFGGIVSSNSSSSSGLPPLPTSRAQTTELPSNQFDASTSSDAGLLESMLLGDEHLLLRPNPSMVKVPSMPALSCYREPGPRPLHVHGAGAGSDGDVTSHSHFPPGPGEEMHPHHGAKWDFNFEAVKPVKRRTASEVGISDMFGGIAQGSSTPTVPGDWFGGCGGSTGPSSAVTDDDFNLEMQQFMSLLPLSIDEHGWNA